MVADQFHHLNDDHSMIINSITEQRGQLTERFALMQTEFSKLFDDHKSATRNLVDDYKSSYIADIARTSQFTMKALQQNARLEAQRPDLNQKSSSSSGCCMGFLPCSRTTPATAPAMAVVPNSIWDQKSSTAALPSQLLSEHRQIIEELQRKVTQLESTTITGGSSGSGGLGNQ